MFRWQITIPANTTATLYVPTKDVSSVTESGQPIDVAQGIRFLRMEEGRAVYEAGSGKYEFSSTYVL
jgi:alpha-L-rhamnosidase